MMRFATIFVIVLANQWICATVRTAFAENANFTSPIAFVSQYLERGDASTVPRPEQIKGVVAVAAAAGEYEPATFSVRAGEDELKGVSVRLSGDLKTETGEMISTAAVQIRLVEPFERWKDRKYPAPITDSESQTNKHHEWSLPLLESTLDIAPHTTRRFWLTVHVPPDAKPGTYRSKIAISHVSTRIGPELGRSVPLSALDYEVSVLPIRLASAPETGMAFFMYNNTGYYSPDLVTPEYQKRVLTDMREHGMTTATLYIYPKVKDGQVDLAASTERHLSFTQWMSLLKETGLPAHGLPAIWLGAENYSADVWKAVLQERLRRDWPEIVFYAVDEPGEEDRNIRVRAFMEQFNGFRRENPQYGVRVTTAIGETLGIKTVGHYYDLWIGCMGQKEGEKVLIDFARKLKKPLWTYDCMLAPIDAETDRYYFGIWAWVSGVGGCAHWNYYDGGPRLSYVYPSPEKIIPTVGWEAVREGIDDYRYLFTLKRLADAARADGKGELVKEADRIFAEVKGMVTMDRYGQAYLTALDSKVEMASAYQRVRAEPILESTAYDKLRRKIANEIVRLSQAGILGAK